MVRNASPASGKLAVLSQAAPNASFCLHEPFIPHLALSMQLYQVWNSFFPPYFKGTAHELTLQVGRWLQTLFGYNRVDRDTGVDLGFLLCVRGCALEYGPQRCFKGSQRTAHKRAVTRTENFGEKSKPENRSVYFAAYTGDEQFWVSGIVLLLAGQREFY